MKRSRVCFLAVGAIATLSCSSDRPTQPAAVPPPQYQLTTLSGGPIPIPGNNDAASGSVDWTPVGATVANKFILIKVTGTDAISSNQNCSDTFTLPCQYPLSGEVVGPLGDLYGWLKVSVRETPGSTPGLSGPTGGTTAQGVIFGSGGVVQAKRTGVWQNGQSCSAHPL